MLKLFNETWLDNEDIPGEEIILRLLDSQQEMLKLSRKNRHNNVDIAAEEIIVP